MPVNLQKGSTYSADFSSTHFPVLDGNWTGSVTLYSTYPTAPVVEFPLTLSGNVLQLRLTIADIAALEDGVYTLLATMNNPVLDISVSNLDFASVSAISIVPADKTLITMTIAKIDGTPAGKEVKNITNSTNGVTVIRTWDGVVVNATQPVASAANGVIIGTETISTTTNEIGYAQLLVLKGQTVVVNCPSFKKSVTVDTTGQSVIDLSSYF